MQAHTIKLKPEDELAQWLNQHDTEPVIIEANGVCYDVVRRKENIWAGYDPERAVRAIEKSAGALKRAGLDGERLEKDTYEDRTQNSTGHLAE
jgi:hypothetical protein